MTKIYHIDRACLLHAGDTLILQNGFYVNSPERQKCLDMVETFHKDGLSSHGISYFLNGRIDGRFMDLSNVMEIVLEYERLLHYENKLSRYKSFFAFDRDGVIEFIKMNNLDLNVIKIYEVESDYCEKHNMNLIKGETHYNIAALTKCYWEDLADPFNKPVLNEYLLKFPVKIIKEVKLSELE